MKVIALNGFVGRVNGQKYIVQKGQELELPEGADWLRAGLVEAVEAEPETEPEAPKKKRSKKDSEGA